MLNEVAPPGFGHTKGDKGKGVKKGGTAAAFDKARKEGRFKGSKSDMFAIMWSQKNKGDKPHYKPGTDKKYKKYQEESTMPNVDSKDKKVIKARAKNLFKRDLKGDHEGVNESVQNNKVDLILKTDVNNVLKQDNKDYDRGLLAKVNKDGSYDVAYWYDEYKAYPVEVVIDGKSIKKDAKNIHIKYHPELKKKNKEEAKDAMKEETSMADNNLFQNAYAGSYEQLKKKIGSKEKHDKPAYKDFVKKARKK